MPRKLDRAPIKTSGDQDKAETNCICTCKSPSDASGAKDVPQVDRAALDQALYHDLNGTES